MTSLNKNIKSIIAAISGNFVEWYDFALYLFLAPVIAKQFFPESGALALLATFTVHAVSFFFRPLGAVLFGHIGDVHGRRVALRLSLSGLAILSISIAFLPNYNSIGPIATLLLCLCRIGQGICLGGEFAGSMIYLAETANSNKRSLCTSLSNNASNLGCLIAAGSTALVATLMSETDFALYGYRVLFLIGGIIGLLGFTFRQDLKETTTFIELKQRVNVPILSVIQSHRKAFMTLFLILIISALGSYALIGYMSTFLNQSLSIKLDIAFRYELLFLGITLVLVPFFAHFSDKFSPRKMLISACSTYIILSIPCYYLLYTFQQPLFLLPLIIAYSMEQSCVPALMMDYFPAEIRYTGVSITYNICMALIGGLSPLLGQLFIGTWKLYYGIPYLLIIGAVIALLLLRKTSPQFKISHSIQKFAGYS